MKRPKTPLITAGDILKQAQSLSERKASACGSLPDIVSSSVDTTELHASRCCFETCSGPRIEIFSRCSLLEGDELPEDENKAELPLPDIVASEEEVREVPPAPPILIEEAEDFEEAGDCPPCEPLVASPQPPAGLTKDYTVEEGFERPEGGWEAAESVTAASVEANCDSEEEEEEDTAGAAKSSSSSSLPSESSGIFYKAEYTPHPSHLASPAPNAGLLSVENRDSYWSSFFHPTRSSEAPGCLRKSSSGNMEKVRGLPPRPSQVTKSKSDAKVNYSAADIPIEEEEVVKSVENKSEERGTEGELETAFPEIEAIREEIVVARSSVKTPKAEEVDVRPWTECSSGHSPETSNSRDNLSSTISQEMQDLLSSIQSLGKTDSGESGNHLPSLGRRISQGGQEESNKAGLHRLMAEVESQIRFSATEELLQRMAACPSVEQEGPSADLNSFTCNHKVLASPPVPDLLRPAIDSPSEPLTPSFASSLESPGNRRITALQRPSDMANGRPFTPTGRVPDMLSRVSCGHDSNNFSNLEAVRDDLSKVRNDIDSLRESLNETKTNVVANSRDILARCSFYTEAKRAEGSPEASSVSGKSRVSDSSSMGMREGGHGSHGSMGSQGGRVSGSSMESDLAETSSAMRDIERTVNSFSRPSPTKVRIVINEWW